MAHRRPQPARARRGRNVVPARVNRKNTTRASNFHHSGTSGSVDRKRSSGLDRMHLSRTSAPCHSESHVVGGSADAFTRRWTGRKPSRRRQDRRVESHRGARSAGGSHSVCTPTSTTTGADRRWPQRNTVIHSARRTGSPAPLRVARSPVAFLVATLW